MSSTALLAKTGARNLFSSVVSIFALSLAISVSPLSLGEARATTFKWMGTFHGEANVLRRPPRLYDWIGGFWVVEVEGKLEQEVKNPLSPDQWSRIYSITAVSFTITLHYKSNKVPPDPYSQPTEFLSEVYTHVLDASNFNLAFNMEDFLAQNYNSSFIVECSNFPWTGYQIFLKYDQKESLVTPRGSTLQLGGGIPGQMGGFQIVHQAINTWQLKIGSWPTGTDFFVPDGYENVSDAPTDITWLIVNETQSVAPSFTYSGCHDATTKSLSRFYVNTAMVDEKPLAGGLIRFDGAGMFPEGQGSSTTEFFWDFDGGELMWYDGDSSKPVVRFIKPRNYTVTLSTISDFSGNNLTAQRDIDLSLETGDLIFIRTPKWTGPFDLINECYTHVGMYVGDGVMIEAAKDALAGNLKGGVQLTPISRWGYPTEVFATAYRVKGTTQYERMVAVQFAIDRLGRPYDSNALTKQLLGNSYYCSELVWAAYYTVFDIDLGQTGANSILPVHPDHIAQDIAHVTFIGGHWEHYEPQMSKGRAMGAIVHMLLSE